VDRRNGARFGVLGYRRERRRAHALRRDARRPQGVGLRTRGGELLQPRGQLRIEPPKDRIRCLQLGFGHNYKIANLHVSQFMPARSFPFKQSKKPDAKRKSFPSIQAVQLSTSSPRDTGRCPNYLQIDAPGFTPEIFVGAWKTLANPALRQIQVETKKSKGDPRIAELLAQFGFKPVGQAMRPGQVQRELVLARDISRRNAPTILAPGANTEVAYRRGAAEPSR
jgi:hypothetical protein